MTILLPMLLFLAATLLFYWLATRDPEAYGRDPGRVAGSLPWALPLAVAGLACLALTLLPPKGFHDLSLRYLGIETVLPVGERMVVGGDLAKGHFLSGLAGDRGEIFSLENQNGSVQLVPQTDDLEIAVDGEPVTDPRELFAARDPETDAGRETVTVSVANAAGTLRYRVARLTGFLRSEQRRGVTISLRYERPYTEPIFFPSPDPEALVPRETGVLLLTNRQSSSAHDELRLPVPQPAGPVIAKLEKAEGRDDAVLLITPRERLLLEIGSTAQVKAYGNQRWVLLQLTDQTILDAKWIRLALVLIFVPSLLLLMSLFAARRSPAAIVVYLVALALLSFRFVIGVRAASLYPYHYEAFSLSLAGLVLLPLYTVAITQIGPVAAGIAGVPGRLGHAGGRHQMLKHLAGAKGLGEILAMTVLTAALMAFLPSGEDGSQRDTTLIGLAFLPLAFLLISIVLRRTVLRLPFFHHHVRALSASPTLLAQLVEVDTVTRDAQLRDGPEDLEREIRFWLSTLACGGLLMVITLALWKIRPNLLPEKTLLGMAILGSLMGVFGGALWARASGYMSWLDRGAVGRWRNAWRDRLRQPGTVGRGLLDWWLAPAGRLSALTTALVILMVLFGRRETLITQPRLPLMLIYGFLFLAMATANMVFIGKKSGRERDTTSLLVIGITLVPLMLYSAIAHDYGSAIAMFVPLLAVLAFAVLRGRALKALPVFFLIVIAGVPLAYGLGGDYLKYRVTSVLRGPSGLEAETSRTAQNTLEQVMQMRFYATAGDNWLSGLGYGAGEVGRGLRQTSLNDNVFSVFVVSEMGTAVGAALGLIYALLLGVVLHRVLRSKKEKHTLHTGRPSLAQAAMLFGLCLSVVFIASYMIAANTGMAPLTGKNLPFLGLNSKSDLIQHLLVFALMISMLLRGLVTPATATVAPVQMTFTDGSRQRPLRLLGVVLFGFSLATSAWTLGQWFNKPAEVIRFSAYNEMLRTLADETNDFGRRDRTGHTRPEEQPPLRLYRNADGRVQIEIIAEVVEDFFPDYQDTWLLRHAREFNRTERDGSGRSIFRLRRVSETGNPQHDYELRTDSSYMRIVSPFRGQTWRGEILARDQDDYLTLESLGDQPSVAINGETQMGRGRELRLLEFGRQVVLERVDDTRNMTLGYKVNGFDFAAWHPNLPPPKFLVLREDDFMSAPDGIYLMTYTEESKLSKVKTVNGRLERAYPEGESFYYARNLTTSLSDLSRQVGLDEGDGTLRLTLDTRLNRQLFDRIEPVSRRGLPADKRRRVAVTVMDLRSGDLLALASAPSVNPNRSQGSLPDYQQILYENHNLRTHPMGSAIKPLFAGAALYANPDLADLRVLGGPERTSQLAGYPFDADIASGGGANSLPTYLERSSNSFQFYLSLLALAEGEGGLFGTAESFTDDYQIFIGDRQLTTRPNFGQLLRQEGQLTLVDKLDESRLARGFNELFDIFYSSEATTYFESQLWQPMIDWLEVGEQRQRARREQNGDTEPQSVQARMSVEASLPDISLIAFDRMSDLRRHFLSTTLGGAEGRLHNVRIAEAFARLATGKMVTARLMNPFTPLLANGEPATADPPVDPTDDSQAASDEADGSASQPVSRFADLPLDETARAQVAQGLSLVFESPSGTAHPKTKTEHAAFAALGASGWQAMGKTGTHVDKERGETVTDSVLAAVLGLPESDIPGSRLIDGLAVIVYVQNTDQNAANALFFDLLPTLVAYREEALQ